MATYRNPAGEQFDETDGYDCGDCTEPNSADTGMVQCDRCLAWYHLRCAGQTPGVSDRPWHCLHCPPIARPVEMEPGAKKKGGKKSTKSALDIYATSVAKSDNSRKCGRLGAVKDTISGTPLKNPEIPKPASQHAKSIRSTTSSVRARNQLVVKRLEEERKLAEEKFMEARKRLTEAMQERERELRKMKLEMKEEYVKKMIAIEETALENEDLSECDSLSGSELAKQWLKEQRDRNQPKPPTDGKKSFADIDARSNQSSRHSGTSRNSDEETGAGSEGNEPPKGTPPARPVPPRLPPQPRPGREQAF